LLPRKNKNHKQSLSSARKVFGCSVSEAGSEGMDAALNEMYPGGRAPGYGFRRMAARFAGPDR